MRCPDLTVGARVALGALALAPATPWSAELLSHSPDDRLVVRYDVHLGGSRRVSAVTKTYPDAAEGAQAALVMRALGRAAGGTAYLRVPVVLGWDAAERVLVMSTARGRSLRVCVAAGELPSLEQAGRALAELHALPVPACLGAARGLGEHAARLCRPAPLPLAAALPRYAELITGLYAEAIAGAATAAATAPLHRDLHPGQLLEDGGRTTVLDWDLAAAGDPALDLANLLVHLDTRLPAARAAPAQDAVRRGYDDDAVADRLPAFEVLAYLRMAAKRFRLGPGAGGPLDVDELLRRAGTRRARAG